MTLRARYLLPIGFIASALASGIPYWTTPYHQVNLPSALYGPGLLVLLLAAATTRVFTTSAFGKIVLILGGSLPAIVMLRVAVETSADPTSHNLWPLEVIIASMLGGVCALSGAIVGWAIAKLRASGAG